MANVLGCSETEPERLPAHMAMLQPITEELLRAAGIGPGHRVLDAGSGAGDVSFLLAGLVGADGSVTGVDRSVAAVRQARCRALAAGSANVRFVQAEVTEFVASGGFDAVVSRNVLGHQADPVAFVRHAARLTGPGGVLAFHEADIGPGVRTAPRVPLVHQVWDWIASGFRWSVPHSGVGGQLGPLLAAAGLPRPVLSVETVTEAPGSWLICGWLTELLASMLPVLVRRQVVTEAEADLSTLEWRLRSEVSRAASQVELIPQVCAWVRIPDGGRCGPAAPRAGRRAASMPN